jgi:hypothetical protein
MKELLRFLGVVVLVISIFILPIIGISTIFGMNFCSNLAELNPDRSFEWRFFGGCMMQTQDGIWLSVDDITFFDKPIEGVK